MMVKGTEARGSIHASSNFEYVEYPFKSMLNATMMVKGTEAL
jgi:hypothetical protein